MDTLERIFNPKSIAIIGASSKTGAIGNLAVQNLIDSRYEGAIYPINPSAATICGLPAFKSIMAVPVEYVDLALYTVPEKLVCTCAKEAVQKNVAGHVVISSGFSEVGNVAGEVELNDIVRPSGGRVLGPNIMGVLLNHCRANASFGPMLPPPGRTAIISQSGALLLALDFVAWAREFGCSSMVSLGNMSDLDFADCVDFYAQDPKTACISLYVEGAKNGRKFIESGRNAGKPILALKSGVSAHGAAAAASHTGSLAGAAKVYEAAFDQARIIRAADIDELLDCSQALSKQPPLPGDNVIVITNGGGIGVLSSDSAELFGLPLHVAPQDLQAKFAKCMPAFGSPKNPVDITGGSGAKGYEEALVVALESDWVHGVAVLYCETAVTQPEAIADAIMSALKRATRPKPVVACFVGGELSVAAGRDLCRIADVPVYDNPKKAMCALGALRQAAKFAARPKSFDEFRPFPGTEGAKAKAKAIIAAARAGGRTALTEPESENVFRAYGLPVARSELAKTEDDAWALAQQVGLPVVMKIVSPQILHKSDAGGVKVGLRDEAGVREAFRTILENARKYKADAEIHGVLIMEMAAKGREVIVGSVNDGTFGPTLMYGLGGIFVEVLKDVTFRVAPFSVESAMAALPMIKSFPILAGTRGEKPADLAALAELMSRASQLVWELKDEVAEMDANPCVVYNQGEGIKVVDGRFILTKPGAAPAAPAHH